MEAQKETKSSATETKESEIKRLQEDILFDLPEMSEDINKKEWHKEFIKYLNKKIATLPEDQKEEIEKIQGLVDEARKEADIFIGLRDAIKQLQQETTLKEFKLLYFLEKFYNKDIFYSSILNKETETEKYFNMAVSYSAKQLDEEDFLAGVYPAYFEEE